MILRKYGSNLLLLYATLSMKYNIKEFKIIVQGWTSTTSQTISLVMIFKQQSFYTP